MTEVTKTYFGNLGPDLDILAGDINVGPRKIGFLFGAYGRITNQFQGMLTGKPLPFGGSQMRTEATGYGGMYFLEQMLAKNSDDLDGKSIIISGSGNVATYAAEKATAMGAKVISLSDSTGFIHDPDGLSQDRIDWVRNHKAQAGASLEAYVAEFGGTWTQGGVPWGLDADIAVPCATQNELDEKSARALISNGVQVVIEGANMPCTAAAKSVFRAADILYAPGKAANAGGVAVSGLEISQDRMRRPSTAEDVDASLRSIMSDIHGACVEEGTRGGIVDYVKWANIAGFRKVADAMLSQGVG